MKKLTLRKLIIFMSGLVAIIIIVGLALNPKPFAKDPAKNLPRHTKAEYIRAAEPLLKEILQENYPETPEQKKIVKFWVNALDTSTWETNERPKMIPKGLVEPGGKFVKFTVTIKEKNICPVYTIEIYVSPDLQKTKVTYSDYPKYGTALTGEPGVDQECGIQQSEMSSAEFANMGFGTIKYSGD